MTATAHKVPNGMLRMEKALRNRGYVTKIETDLYVMVDMLDRMTRELSECDANEVDKLVSDTYECLMVISQTEPQGKRNGNTKT